MRDDRNLHRLACSGHHSCLFGREACLRRETRKPRNPQEGLWMVQAARKHQRVVQMGNQRRTWPAIREAIARLHSGVIGETTFARCWYDNARGSIGVGQNVPTPPHLNYAFVWQGPALGALTSDIWCIITGTGTGTGEMASWAIMESMLSICLLGTECGLSEEAKLHRRPLSISG